MKNRKRFLRYRNNLRKWQRYGIYLEGECPFCGADKKFYYERFEAVCCLGCDEWLEKACNDPECTYCANRPQTPSEGLFYENERNDLRKNWRRNNYQHKNNGRLRHKYKKEMYADIKCRKYKI